MYYNTTNLVGPDLKAAVSSAKRQMDAIDLIYQNTGKAYTPWQIWELLQRAGHPWLIGSVRRTITDLEQEGKLMKTGELVKGPQGKPENKWIKRIVMQTNIR